jgi:hypothetical protein
VIQSDLLQLLVIRVCALCEAVQNRADDASIAVLVSAVGDQKVRAGLIAADERWRAGIGPRAERRASVARQTRHPPKPRGPLPGALRRVSRRGSMARCQVYGDEAQSLTCADLCPLEDGSTVFVGKHILNCQLTRLGMRQRCGSASGRRRLKRA